MTCNEAGRIGAEKRKQIEREPILAQTRRLRAALGMAPSAALWPPLLLSGSDRL